MSQPIKGEQRVTVDEVLIEAFATELAQQHEPGRETTVVDRVLFPTDFSPSSLHALRYAEELARRFDAEILVLYVDYALSIYDLPGDDNPVASRALERAVDLLRAHGYRARGVYRRGVPADEIVRAAAGEHVGVIVMGTHGRTGVKHVLMGSVAESVVRHADCPVMTVRGGEPVK